jgi:hypothetical protein
MIALTRLVGNLVNGWVVDVLRILQCDFMRVVGKM